MQLRKDFMDLLLQREKLERWIATQPPDTAKMLTQALKLATEAHQGQLRDEGGDYIIHPIRTVLIMTGELGMNNPEYATAMLLHDVVEDTPTTIEQIRNQFGEKIAYYVNAMTRPRSANEAEEQKRVDKWKKLQEYLTSSQDVRLLKCLDVLDNMRSWSMLTPNERSRKKIQRWIDEAHKFYLQLADRTNTTIAKELQEAVASARGTWGI